MDFACLPPLPHLPPRASAPYPLLWSACTAQLLCLCALQGVSWRAIPCAVLPAMCPRLIRGHQRQKISFLLVLGLHFLNHLARSFVFCNGNNSMSSLGHHGFSRQRLPSFESGGI